jgi:conjugative relaxase-like TrwC/TraI family protein
VVLNLHQLGHGGEAYYLDQVVSGVEDYYGEAPGYWLASSHQLGLEGTVDGDELRAVLSGVDPSTGQQLHAARNRKVPGWDLTFRAPKSVSILWALSDDAVSGEIAAAHDAAVARAVRYMEETGAFTRTGRNGVNRVATGGFVAAGFRHSTSRDRDPLLHTHVLVANSVRADDGRWRTIDSKGLYDHAKTGGFLYQVELRHELTRRLGVSWNHPVKGMADVAGVPGGLIDVFSKRRAAIEAELADWGMSSAAAAQVATLETRRSKDDCPESFRAQQVRWRAEAEAAGFDVAVLGLTMPGWSASGQTGGQMPAPVDAAEPVAKTASTKLCELLAGYHGLTESDSTFDRRDVLQRLSIIVSGGQPVDEIERITDVFLNHHDVFRVGCRKRTGDRYTTRDMWDVERRVVARITNTDGHVYGQAEPHEVDQAIGARPSISDEQAAAVLEMCRSGRPVDVVIAAAGTGKTFSLDAARQAWEQSGFTVIGCALAAAAAQELQDSAGIPACTLARLSRHLGLREAELTSSTVVVVDEAAMVGTRDLSSLLYRAEHARAKVVLVGDPKQLPEIAAGGVLAHVDAREQAIALTENRRQTDPTERRALNELRAGDVDQAIGLFNVHGGVVSGGNADTIRGRMVGDWWTHCQAGDQALMLARRNIDVDDLNRRARTLMADAGRLVGEPLVVKGRPFQIGDEIVCLRNDTRLAVNNGTIGTITGIDHDRRRISIDTTHGERTLDTSYVQAGSIRHGYAVTVHKAQGRTVDHGLLLGTDDLSRESGYVGLSRGRHSNRLYTIDTDRDDADELEPHHRPNHRREPDDLVLDALHHSSAKQLAIDQTASTAHDDGADIGW